MAKRIRFAESVISSPTFFEDYSDHSSDEEIVFDGEKVDQNTVAQNGSSASASASAPHGHNDAYNDDMELKIARTSMRMSETNIFGEVGRSQASMEIVKSELASFLKDLHGLQGEVDALKLQNRDVEHQFSWRRSTIFNPGIIENLREDNKYPTDCYSFIALNGPKNHGWPKQRMIFFSFGFMVFFFQVIFLLLMILSRVLKTFKGFIPANAEPLLTVSKIFSLLAYALFPDSTLMDVYKAYQYFPLSKKKNRSYYSIRNMRLACILRGIQGYLATIAVFLVVLTSETVIDIILNFAALNFVSSFDDQAFDLALSGVFGKRIKKEAKRIENETLPAAMVRKSSVRLYWSVMGSTAGVLLFLLTVISLLQNSPDLFVTQSLRVDFKEETGLNMYSGCYSVSDSMFQLRYSYSSNEKSVGDSSYGYCAKESRWLLFEGALPGKDPCDILDSDKELARSTETDDFDIKKSFEEPWFYASSNIPIDLSFSNGLGDDLYCDMFLGDGTCDQPFNEFAYDFDNGDCCAATCSHPNCRTGAITSAFDHSNTSGFGFPTCKDPKMVPITIHLNDIVSSRDPQFTADRPCGIWSREEEDAWREETPVNPKLLLNCNDHIVLTNEIKPTMQGKNETVWVEDGSYCFLAMTNTSNKFDRWDSIFCSNMDPIWFVNYTIFHGNNTSTATDPVEILTQHSSDAVVAYFARLPECYFRKLKDYVDMASIYMASDATKEAINWLLLGRDNWFFQCEEDSFLERFALATMVFAMKGRVGQGERGFQCYWSWIICTTTGDVIEINLSEANLTGAIPREVSMLTNLEQLHLSENQITSIPSEIEKMENLEYLMLQKNNIASIPKEIGSISNLAILWLSHNQISSIPNEIGSLTALKDLQIGDNRIESIPSEIGSLTNLEGLWLHENQITSFPTEIGLLENLKMLWSQMNQITTLPTEFGLLTNLEAVSFNNNNLTVFPPEILSMKKMKELRLEENKIPYIPSEVWRMTDLWYLVLSHNQITSFPSQVESLTKLKEISLWNNRVSSIPTEIGKNTDLELLWLSNNTIRSIPSEIGLLTNLREFMIRWNQIGSIPTEIGMMTNLERLWINNNEVVSVPTEIGRFTNLQQIRLFQNNITSIPSEIGRLTKLEKLDLSNNPITFIPSEIGLMSNLMELSLWNTSLTVESIPLQVKLLCSSMEEDRCQLGI